MECFQKKETRSMNICKKEKKSASASLWIKQWPVNTSWVG